jgi:hypothetical protein
VHSLARVPVARLKCPGILCDYSERLKDASSVGCEPLRPRKGLPDPPTRRMLETECSGTLVVNLIIVFLDIIHSPVFI